MIVMNALNWRYAVMKIDACPMTGFEAKGYDFVPGLNKINLTATVICPIGKRYPDDLNSGLKEVRCAYDEMISVLWL